MMKNLANKLVKKLIKKKLKISFAESCTGGMLSSTITSVNGSSKVFNLGLVTYSNKAKIDILKVSKKIITKYGAVSSECCLSMVKNLSKISKANISISVTGVAGPSGGTKLKPVGLVYIRIKKGHKIFVEKILFKNKDRISIQKATTTKILKTLLTLK
jgi:nicotinamide-nucleotide amidase